VCCHQLPRGGFCRGEARHRHPGQKAKLEHVRGDDVGAGQQPLDHRLCQFFGQIEPPPVAKDRVENIAAGAGGAPGIDESGDGVGLPDRTQIAGDHSRDLPDLGHLAKTGKDIPDNMIWHGIAHPAPIARMCRQHDRGNKQRREVKSGQNRTNDIVADKADSDRGVNRQHILHHPGVVLGIFRLGK